MELNVYDIVNRHQIYLERLKKGRSQEFLSVVIALDALIRDEFSTLPFANLSSMTKLTLERFVAKFKRKMIGIYDPWLRKQLEWFEEYIKTDIGMFATLFAAVAPEAEDKLDDTEDEDYWIPIFARWKNAPLGANGILPVTMLTSMIGRHINLATSSVRRSVALAQTPAEAVAALRGTPVVNRNNGNYRNRQSIDPQERVDADLQARTTPAPNKLEGGLLNKFNAEARAATDTVIQAASVQANSAVGSLIRDRYQWVSVMDGRTTQICTDLNLKIFFYGKGPLPPAHVKCRSSIIPYFGFDAPDENLVAWARRQSSRFREDAFDGRSPSDYDRSSPLDLEQFRSRADIILSED